MKTRNWLAVALGVVAIVFLNCISPETGPGIPQNLALAAGADGISVVLTWQAPTETVDGYNIYFRTTTSGAGAKIGSTAAGTLTYTDAGSQKAGYYYVTSYTGVTESDKSNEVDDTPAEGTGQTVYEWKGVGSSGYGWNTAGTGSVYSWAQGDAADIFLYGGDTAPGIDPMQIMSANENPWGGGRVSGILDQGGSTTWDSETQAPEIGAGLYYNWENAVNGHIYFLATTENYCVKIQITDVGGSYPDRSITFKYAFQKLGPKFYLF
jgi:hypothetical protein